MEFPCVLASVPHTVYAQGIIICSTSFFRQSALFYTHDLVCVCVWYSVGCQILQYSTRISRIQREVLRTMGRGGPLREFHVFIDRHIMFVTWPVPPPDCGSAPCCTPSIP